MNTATGAGKLVRLILRRDRVLMPLWVLAFGLIPLSYVTSFTDLFPTAADRQQYADLSANNATFVALYGPLSGSSIGELVAWRGGFIPIMIGLISLLTVIRHTRTDEEAGRRELVGSAVVGRHAGLMAALLATGLANLAMGLVLSLGLIGQNQPAAGSLALGAQFTVVGWIFAAIGGLAAQLTAGAGRARGIAIVVLGATFLLRVIGDISKLSDGALSWLSWLSPIGLVQRIQPYAGERWWVLAPAVGLAALLAWAAVALSARRDVGAGLLPDRLGPAVAAPGLRSTLALAWRLHRGLLASWTAGFAVLGVVFGGVAKGFGDMMNGNQTMQEIMLRLGGKAGIIDAYLAAIMGILGLIAAGYAVQATLKLRVEEANGRAEPLLAGAVGRLRWAGSHLAFSALGPVVALATAGLAAGLTYGLSNGDVGRQVPRVLAGAMLQLPAVWVLAAVALLLIGLLPRLAPIAWGALALCLLLGLVGAALQLSQWMLDVSPFTHIPKAPGGTVSATPLVWLIVVTVALAGMGLFGLRRRDIPTA